MKYLITWTDAKHSTLYLSDNSWTPLLSHAIAYELDKATKFINMNAISLSAGESLGVYRVA